MSISLRADASRAIVVLDGVDRVAFNEDGSMELLTPAAGTPTGNAVPTAGQLGFGKMYESLEQTITLASLTSLAHGLAANPKQFQTFIVCKVAEHGYSIGDVVKLEYAPSNGSGTQIYNYMVSADSANIHATCASGGVFVLNKSTAAGTLITPANWRLIVRAWA